MAREEIFGRTASTFGGAFSADDAVMTFPAISDASGTSQRAQVPFLLQSAQFDYQQQITRLYELTSSAIYYVAGRAEGSGSLSQVLGPTKLSQNFLRTYGQVCNAGTNILHFSMATGCRGTGTAGVGGTDWSNVHSFTANFVVLNGISLGMVADTMIIQQTLGMTVGSMEYDAT